MAFTIIEAGEGRACPAKTFGVDASGKPAVTIPGGQPAAGTARRVTATGTPAEILAELGTMLETLSSREALVCVPPPAGRDAWPFATKKEAEGRKDLISRSRDHFVTQEGHALFGLDFDIKAWPKELKGRVGAHPEQLSGVLAAVAPAFAQAVGLTRASSSAGVRNKLTGAKTDLNGGQHRFYVVPNGRDIGRAVTALHKRLILEGWGYAFIFETGHVEIRSLVDVAASATSERLWFEGASVLSDDALEHVPGARRPETLNPAGSLLDTATILDLTEEELRALAAIETDLKKSVEAEASAKRTAWKESRKAALIAKGVDPERAAKTVGLAIEQHELAEYWSIQFDDGTPATVAEIVAAPMRFHKKTCPDPLEPDYGSGRNLAILYGDADPVRIESQAHGGIRYILRRNWCDEEPATVEAAGVSDGSASVASAASTFEPLFGDGPEPIDIFGDEDPAILGEPPAGSLPPLIERWSRTEARRKGVQMSFPATAALTVLASAIGTTLKINVRQNDDWTEPAGLWTVLIAPPGSTKTPVINAAAKPLRALDIEWQRADRPVQAEWVRATKALKRGEAALPEPRKRRAVVDDITSEKLVGLFADNPGGLLRDTDELSGVFGALGAYKKSADGDRSQLLRLFEGGSISRDRQTSGSVQAETALLSILAGSQPAKMQKLVADLGSDGMLQRFLVVLHDGVERKGIDEAPDADAVAAYERCVRYLKAAEYLFPDPLRLTAEAGRAMAEAEDRLSLLRFVPGSGDEFHEHVRKWGKLLPRLVLVFHAVSEFERCGLVDPGKEIEESTVLMAARFARFIMLHSLRFYEAFFSQPDAVSEARWIAGHILSKPDLTEFTRRDITEVRKKFRGPENVKALLASLSELTNAGWCEVVKTDGDGQPGRWKVNAKVRSRFAARAAREIEERSARHAGILAACSERKRLGEPNGNATAESGSIRSSVFD